MAEKIQPDAGRKRSKLAGKAGLVVATILAARSITEAAKSLGVSERTLYRYTSDPRFKTRHREARRTLVEATIGKLQSFGAEAAGVLRDALKDPDANVRVRAATTIVDRCLRGLEVGDLLEKVTEIEALIREKQTT